MIGKNFFAWFSGRLLKMMPIILFVTLFFMVVLWLRMPTGSQGDHESLYENHTLLIHTKREMTHSKLPAKISLSLKNIVETSSPKDTTDKHGTSPSMRKVSPIKPCYNLHTFYYPWYGTPKFDNQYIHWNHQLLPHWNANIAKKYPSGVHQPPDDVGSDFFPELGAYSSRDPSVIRSHMEQLQAANIGVIIVSYYPPSQGDDNGKDWQDIFPMLLNTAVEFNIKVGFHIEPYKNRNQNTVKDDIKYIINTYSSYPAFFQLSMNGKTLPMIYVYDSYHTKPEEWSTILKKNAPNTIRGTKFDAFVIGLYVKISDGSDLKQGGFDGFYTYFAANGFTYGSSLQNWNKLSQFALKNGMIFIPSVGPGYVDTRIRPWNGENTRNRLKGKYYKDSWREALNLQPEVISITSFNEWHEGTQIEKAVPHLYGSYNYKNYKPHQPDYYLYLTNKLSKEFQRCSKN